MSMGMKPTLVQGQRLGQQLTFTPQLQQAIKLLQCNHIELVTEIANELAENPTLEEFSAAGAESAAELEQATVAALQPAANDAQEQSNGTSEGAIDFNKLIENQEADFRPKGSSGLDELPPIETNLVAATSLTDHLLAQLRLVACTPAEERAAVAIVHNLDHRGWLLLDLTDIAEDVGVELEDVEGALEVVQRLDPPGCASRTLEECLLIQATLRWPEDPFLPVILQRHLTDLEKRNYQVVARAIGQQVEDVAEYHAMIRSLEPWPGRAFGDDDPRYISPDVYVFKVGDTWQITHNEDGLPKLRVNNYYKQVLQGKESTREERDYIKERLSSASQLLYSIYRRQSTIGKVMRSILERQIDFFERGPDFLRPMILRDVADEVGVHESTVSRATSNKYVQCPQGIFELKHFFSNGLPSGAGDTSAEVIRNRVRRLISAEDPNNPLSDDQIVQILKRENVEIARRTVAKYRDALGILPSSKRRVVA